MDNLTALTKSELVELLDQFDDDNLVVFTYDYGDRVHSQIAEGVQTVETCEVVYSEYHKAHKVCDEDADTAGQDTGTVIVLSG